MNQCDNGQSNDRKSIFYSIVLQRNHHKKPDQLAELSMIVVALFNIFGTLLVYQIMIWSPLTNKATCSNPEQNASFVQLLFHQTFDLT